VWKRVFIAAHVLRLRRRAPREVGGRWEQFWAGVRATGDGGDVLWDTSDPAEATRYLDLFAEHADPTLPVVDVGCGNGRFTRALAGRFPRAVGVDLSPAAVALATAESAGAPAVTFRALDMTQPDAGRVLRDDIGGDANVFVRGVLHVLDVPARRRLADSIGTLVGERGRVLIGETNHRGNPLRYLERLGAGPRGLPSALARAVSTGIPPPSAFGDAELEACFPRQHWRRVLVDAHAAITTIPLSTPQSHDTIPGYVAVLARR
jgi:SAM-dependent methyltransferase